MKLKGSAAKVTWLTEDRDIRKREKEKKKEGKKNHFIIAAINVEQCSSLGISPII